MKTLILGMGNTLLSDDGIGIIAKRYLETRLGNGFDLDFIETSWGGFRIIDLLSGYDYAIIVDSIKTNSKPLGYIHQLRPTDLLPTLRLTSYHDINFITALKLADELHAKMPSVIDIFAIEIEDNITICEELNHSLLDSVINVSAKIISLLKSKEILPENINYPNIPITSYELKNLYDEELNSEYTKTTNYHIKLEEYQV
jgi:hydrogenase maturation protease